MAIRKRERTGGSRASVLAAFSHFSARSSSLRLARSRFSDSLETLGVPRLRHARASSESGRCRSEQWADVSASLRRGQERLDNLGLGRQSLGIFNGKEVTPCPTS